MKLLLIDIDSLRADRLGCYGYDRETSPTIDSVADRGVRFDQCYASDTPCLPSRTSTSTARFGVKHGAVTHWGDGQWLNLYDRRGSGGDYPGDRPLAFKHLSDSGVTTATITSFGKRHAAYHFTGSFRESIQPTPGGADNGRTVTNVATDWIDDRADAEDWLLHLNYWDVHHPYLDVEDFLGEVRGSGDGADWVDRDVLADQAGMTGVRSRTLWPSPNQGEFDADAEYYEHGDWPMPTAFEEPEHVQQLNDGYDASIRKVDAEVARLLATLEDHGIREETAVVITADHGEALGEHGIYAEHAMAHPPCQRVPMVVDAPGSEAEGTVTPDPIYQFDLLPTLCDLFDVPTPGGWDAESLTPALDGHFEGREYLVCGHGIYTFSRAVYHDDWVYIRLLHPGVFSYPGLYNDPDLPGEGLELLHDRASDPHMTENLIGERPGVAAEMRSRLESWNAEHVTAFESGGSDPLSEMAATDGPYLYVDPGDLADLYRRIDRSDSQVDRVAEAAETFRAVREGS